MAKSVIHSLMMMSKGEIVKPVIVPTDRELLLKDKVALITGGNSGIGLAIAKAFVSSRGKVILVGTNEARQHL